MNLTETSLRNPAGVLVAILMVALLGIFALVKLPIQLFPNIEEPVISIFTSWRAAAPTEIESEIIEPQERALAGPARHAVAQRLRERRQRLPQPAVRGRHRHAGDDARSHQPHEPAAAAAARCAGAADLAGRRRRQRAQQHAVVVLRAVAARHARAHRQLSPPDRRAVPQPHRVDSRRRQRAHQLRLRRGTADRVRPGARRRARHPDSAHRAGGGQRRRRVGRIRRHRPPPVHRALRGPLFDGPVLGPGASSGATAARCGSGTSPPCR